MRSFTNQIQLIGHLGADPVIVDLENGNKLAKVSIATNSSYKNKDGQRVENTYWHKAIAWGRTAELIGQALSKGNKVILHGQIQNYKYTNKEGQTIRGTQVLIDEFLKVERPPIPF